MYEYEKPKPPQKRKKGKKGQALHGMTTEEKKAAVVGASKPLLIVGGLWLGNLIGKGIDKVVKPDPDGKFHFISLVKPVAQVGVGATIAWACRSKAEDKETAKTIKELAKNIGYGIAGSGVISGAKLLKSDLFEGLGNTTNIEKKPVEAKYYSEAKEEIMKMLQDNSFRPALPEGENVSSLPEDKKEPEMNGLGLNFSSDTEDAEAEIL
jgi:hypothetical protein